MYIKRCYKDKLSQGCKQRALPVPSSAAASCCVGNDAGVDPLTSGGMNIIYIYMFIYIYIYIYIYSGTSNKVMSLMQKPIGNSQQGIYKHI